MASKITIEVTGMSDVPKVTVDGEVINDLTMVNFHWYTQPDTIINRLKIEHYVKGENDGISLEKIAIEGRGKQICP